MGRGGSEEEKEHHPVPGGRVHRFKLNGKAFNECDAVDSAAVPRKLRSVTMKRNRESLSSPLLEARKLCHTSTDSETPCNKVHRSKQCSKLGTMDRSPKRLVSFSITKDEEEVAEALFALARMFPCDKTPKRKGDRKASEAKSALLPEIKSSFLPPEEALKEDMEELPYSFTRAEHTNITSSKEDSPNLTVKVEPVVDTVISEQPHLPANYQNGTFQLDLEKVPTSPMNESNDDKEKIDVNFLNPIGDLCNPYIRNKFSQLTPANVLPILKAEDGPRPVLASVIMKQEQVQSRKEKSENVSNGLPAKCCGSYELGSRSLMIDNSKDRPESVNMFANTMSYGNGASKDKLTYESLKGRQSWKRCATQVYIAQLIQAYKGLEKNRWAVPVPDREISTSGGSKSGATALNNEFSDLKKNLNNSNSSGVNCLNSESSHEARNGMLQDKKLLMDQLVLNTSSFSLQQKQSYDFLSLSPGCAVTKKNKNDHINSPNLVDSSLQTHIPRLQSLHQHHSDAMPLPQTRYCSRHPDQIAAATSQQVHLQQFPYLGHVTATSKQQSTQQQQLWGAQLGQYPSNILPYLPKWQNGTQHDALVFGPGGVQMASMRSSALDAFGVKFTPSHPQVFANTSSPPSVGKRLTQTGNVDENGGLRTDTCLQQLLCNAQHS